MSVKKLLVLGAAGLAAIGATVAIAGGPDHMAMPVEAGFQKNVYLEGHLGYAQVNWNDFNSNNVIGTSVTSLFDANSNAKGAFSGGLDLGYAITQHVAVEGAWFYLPKVSGVGSGNTVGTTSVANSQNITVRSWLAYTAAKLSVPVMDNMDLFGKVGVAYRSLSYSRSITTNTILNGVTGHGHYWAPLFATGLQYNWDSWIVGAQYLFLPSNSSVNYANTAFGAPNAAPAVNLYTGFVGYKFDV